MTHLTAVDILVNPDDATLERARRANARMRESVPSGFSLDATHQPHITTLQWYVRSADLDGACPAVEATVRATDVGTLTYRALAIGHADWGVPGQGLAAIVLRPSAAALDLQARLLAAITPFTEPGGTDEAFVRDPGESISQTTKDWVDGYVPNQLGEGKYVAHITVGFATLDDLTTIEAEPFDPFDVHPASVAVYHLGNSGAARQVLREWPLS